MRAAMVLMSFLCIYLGLFPGPLYALLPYPVDYVPYTGSHVVFQLQLLLFSGLAFFLLLGFLKRTLTITLDFDWFWRGGGRALAREFNWRGSQAWGAFAARNYRACKRFVETIYRHHGPDGILARTRPTGSMTFWMTVMLAAYLVFYLS
jgi:multicomponent Na+:H+ antiporter subunit D